MKKITSVLFFLLFIQEIFGQLSGIINVPSTYTSIASVISALNQQGISGSVTVAIAAGYTETAPSGGYSLTATGTSVNPIFFRKNGNGANPLISAYAGGSGTPGSMFQDGVWRLIGSDYITIDGIDIVDPNISNPATMEFGYGLFKMNSNDGCQYNTIKNCVITLNRVNNSNGAGAAADGSRGIDVVNAVSGIHNATLSILSPGGSNSKNRFISNTIQNCNIGISLYGFADTAPFSFVDQGNDIGGNSIATGNSIVNFGGGGSTNASEGIRTFAQYDLNVSYNLINNNNGSGLNHTATLRGIHLNSASNANVAITNNTLTLNGGGTTSQLAVIENGSGSGSSSNSVTIDNNVISNCTYTSSVSGSFYGIWNTASPTSLNIRNNIFTNNSTGASGGSTYLIYNNGTVDSLINITNNGLSFMYNGPSVYSGGMYSIYNASGTTSVNLNINGNNFSNYNYLNNSGTGLIYFIYNTNDSRAVSICNNTWSNLTLNHSGSEYLIHNSTNTQSLLSVNNNSIITGLTRTGSAGSTYMYYSTGASLANCVQSLTGNNFSNINAGVAGSGVFYGIYNDDGGVSPYPKKTISNNVISNININSTGSFYGYHFDNLGDGSGSSSSSVYNNTITNIYRGGNIYGIYISGAMSPSYAPQAYLNCIGNLNSNGASSTIYSAYFTSSGNAAGLNFFKNRIGDVIATGTAAVAHGIYVAGATTTTLSNNIIGNINTPNASSGNAINGVYIAGGSMLNVFYNTVYLNASGSGGNFNSNAIYASTTSSLNLKNNIFVNTTSGSNGVTAAFRRSSTSLGSYLSTSNNNLFYAGTPSSNNVILQNGTASYQTLTSFQTTVSPRDASSISQLPSFLSLIFSSPNYFHITPNIASSIESGATNTGGITIDFDNQVRQGNTGYSGTGSAPDIGADEFNQNTNPCTGANAGTVSASAATLCAGETVTLLSTGYTPGVGLSHQWKVSATPGGPYINVSGGSGSSSPEFASATLSPGTYYFVMITTCTSISLSATSTEATVVVNPIPSVSASASGTLLCAGSTLSLSGSSSIGTNYNWSGPGGFNSITQNPTINGISANLSGIYYVSVSANNCISPQSSIAITVSSVSLSLNASQNAICKGDSAILTLNTSALNYTWSTGTTSGSIIVTPTITTNYSVIVTNTAGCSAQQTINITVVNLTISANNLLLCGTPSMAILSVNAFSPSTVSWYSSSISSTVLASGSQFTLALPSSTVLYARASSSIGCTSPIVPVSLTVQPNPLLVTSATPATVCPGIQSTLSVSGANTYTWVGIGSGNTRTVAPTSGHAYTVQGKDILGCISSATLVVYTYTVPNITVMQTATSVCPSAPLSCTASGAVSYTWNTGALGSISSMTPAVSTIYTVSGSNSQNCVSSRTVAIVTRSVPVIYIAQSIDTVCPGETITFTASGAASYTWLPGNTISHTITVNPYVTSVYNAIGKSVNTCTNIGMAFIEVDLCLDVTENSEKTITRMFPNPSHGDVNLEFAVDGERKIMITDPFSHIIYENSTRNKRARVDLSAFDKGIYLIMVTYNNNTEKHKLILK
jgi:hypothetical protein